MLRPWHILARTLNPYRRSIRGITDLRPFREGDIALLRQKDDRTAAPILTRPLKPGRRVEGHKGVLLHDDILGKSVRDIVTVQPKRLRDGGEDQESSATQKRRAEYRLHEVKLDDYVRLSKRLLTPIYPDDARLIVDLLDLHPHSLRESDGTEKLEILEAGTGHGALSLYLARAICGANKPAVPHSEGLDDAGQAAELSAWKAERRAVLHTIEISPRYSHHAQGIVEGFRNGLYSPHVDFHVGDVADWIAAAFAGRGGKLFLSHAFLDLPNAETKIEAVTKALRVDGTLIVFNPSITQIMDAAKKIKDDDIPLELEKVVELGVNGGSGGREWDVRPVKPRATQKLELEREMENGSESESETQTERDEEQMAADKVKSNRNNGWSMVCRPKVGDRVVGGGFLGVWKKQRRGMGSLNEIASADT